MNEVKNMLHVGKVVLSSECIAELESLQDNKNEMLDNAIRVVLTSIMLLNLPEGDSDRIREKKKANIEDLSILAMDFERLAAPR